MTLNELCKGYEKQQHVFMDKSKPIIIRLDGKGFSKLTKKLKKPICPIFQQAMQDTVKYLLENIQGSVVGYQQSDEITLVLDSYTKEDSQMWFNGRTDKILSVSGSMATWYFNRRFLEIAENLYDKLSETVKLCNEDEINYLNYVGGVVEYAKSYNFKGMFDSRVFQCEREEIYKMLKWRQRDCYVNSVNSLAQANFSRTQLFKIGTEERRALMKANGIDWDSYTFVEKYGFVMSLVETEVNGTIRQKFERTDIMFKDEKDIYEYILPRTNYEK